MYLFELSMKRSQAIFLVLSVLGWSSLRAASGEMQVWFSPTGPTGHASPEHGFSREDPHKFEWSWVKEAVINDQKPYRSVVLNFLPGTHTDVLISDVQDLKYVPHPEFTAEPAKWRITIQGIEPEAEKTVLEFPDKFWTGANGFVSVIQLMGDVNKKTDYGRVVLQNLTVDGNWAHQNWVGPDFLGTYKLQPVRIFARTARIRNVIVRNGGSHGLIPQTTNVLSGTESFPLCLYSADVGQEPEDGDPAPVVIEDCEIEGLHSVFGGYDTALCVNVRVTRERNKPNYVPEPFSTDPNRRLALVRRNQVRGFHPIAMGSSGGRNSEVRGVTFTGNVGVGSGGLLNTDTGLVSYLDFTNNIGLDVGTINTHGWPNTSFKYGHHHYNIQGNSIRFRGPWTFPIYQNYRLLNGVLTYDADHLILGRKDTNFVSGVTFMGASSDINVSGNWFTSLPPDQFFKTVGRDSDLGGFRTVWKWDNNQQVGESWPALPRSSSSNVTIQKNLISSIGYDFLGLQNLEEGKYADFAASSAGPLSQLRKPLSRPETLFQPAGKLERVVILTTNRPASYAWLTSASTPEHKKMRSLSVPQDRITQGALEVSLGRPFSTNHSLVWVPVRAAVQPAAMGGLTETRVLPNRRVFLSCSLNRGEQQNQQGLTKSNGVAVVAVPIRATNALLNFTAWVDAGSGVEGRFDPYQDAWSTSYWTKGAVVWVTTEPDVACLPSRQKGRVVLHRTGTPEQLALPLAVRLAIQSGPAKAGLLGSDFQLMAQRPTAWVPGDATNPGVVTFAPGSTEAALDVLAAPPSGKEHRVAYFEILPSGATYGLGPLDDESFPSAAQVVLLYTYEDFNR